MQLTTVLEQSPACLISFSAIVGLIVGSFLNVVIYRLPLMLHRDWRQECYEYLNIAPPDNATEIFNLALPGSHCPSCKTSIKAQQNIPLISFLLMGGKCAACGSSISWRYPLVEALAGLFSALVAWRFGYSSTTLFALLFTWGLIALSFIDLEQQLLPDNLTQPLLWLGLLLSIFQVFANSQDAIIGAITGYLSLWSVYHLFRLLTGKEGMGYGDFKLLSVCGAWLGWQFLPQIILLSSVLGSVCGLLLILRKKLTVEQAMPFGPYLALAGWLALIWGDGLNNYYLQLVGLR